MRKIFCFLICTLMIAIVMIPTMGGVSNKRVVSKLGWSETQKIIASDGALDDRFGNSVEVNGIDAIIGAYYDDISGQTNAGSAYVFIYSGGTWTQQAKLTAPDYAADDQFGYSVSIDGDTAVIGSPMDDDLGTSSGSAYVFVRSGISWSLQQKLTAGDGTAADEFGRSVSVEGDYAIVGAPRKNSDQGFSYIFKRTGTAWAQMTKVGATGSNRLGWSVSISMPCVIMGAYGSNSNQGAAHIYELVGTSWMGKGTLTASDGAESDLFGTSVSIDGDYAVCGSPGHDLISAGEGAAYVFEKPTSGWVTMTETQKIYTSDAAASDHFGSSVSVDGNYIISSSPDDDDSGTASGSAYIFKRVGSTWTEVAKLIASDGMAQDYFGWMASISDVFALVGAYTEDNANGVDAGSAYLFEWENQAPLKPDITGPASGKPGVSLTYDFCTTDPDGDDVFYVIDWDDGSAVETIGPYPSAVCATADYSWSAQGSYTITAKAKDVHDAESPSQTLPIEIPRNRARTDFLIQRFLQMFPNAFPILKYFLGI